MIEVYEKIAYIPILFIISFFLKKAKVFDKSSADLMLKIVFYLGLPAILIDSFSKIDLSLVDLKLTFFGFLIISANLIISTSYFYLKKRSITNIYVVGSAIMNNGFLIPFIKSYFGEEGLSRLFILDLANGILAFTIVYFIASKENHSYNGKNLIRFLKSPPLIFLLVAFIIGFGNIQIPKIIIPAINSLSELTIPLIILSLGLYFEFNIKMFVKGFNVLLFRVIPALIVAIFIVLFFDVSKLDKSIIIICAIAPVGFNTLTFASMEDLDTKLASSAVSTGILYGMIVIPIILSIL
ncbi:MAG: AEC family transporter [Candidatus Delongbacteria bacterium]|nr:AEC family transporter [Candidatus Delongbacteria bacterium]MBN2836978.1 AEC family transporter [Candidatus Delongbacteria bacterium]